MLVNVRLMQFRQIKGGPIFRNNSDVIGAKFCMCSVGERARFAMICIYPILDGSGRVREVTRVYYVNSTYLDFVYGSWLGTIHKNMTKISWSRDASLILPLFAWKLEKAALRAWFADRLPVEARTREPIAFSAGRTHEPAWTNPTPALQRPPTTVATPPLVTLSEDYGTSGQVRKCRISTVWK